jgi:sirohydrochlorin ferrochelatase
LSASKDISQAALLIVAHGERTPGARNENPVWIARSLSRRGLVAEVAIGFVSGEPTVAHAFGMLRAERIIVYPLFASSGYFTRDRLVHLLDEANRQGRQVDILPPLGLDPGLPELVCTRARQISDEHGFAPEASAMILLAHGSRRNSASREATLLIASEVENLAAFRDVQVAFLEERPSLGDAASMVRGPAVVVGLFSGEGLHGAKDAPRLIAELGRNDIVYAGVIGNVVGIEDLVARAIEDAMRASAKA